LEKERGGSGVLLGGVTGVSPGHVVILGGGVAGTNAAQMAIGLHARVTIVERSLPRLRQLDAQFNGRVRTAYSTAATIEALVADADLVIGTVLIPGAAAPKLVTRAMLKKMKPGSALVDVSIDQGGCFETSKPTTHSNPTYIVDDIVHYCVANIPGAVPRTSTFALTNATLPFVKALASGPKEVLAVDAHLRNGVNVHAGAIAYPAVAKALGLPCKPYL
jgi:alanine dehydrogenase